MPNFSVTVASQTAADTSSTIAAYVPDSIRQPNDVGEGTATFILNVTTAGGVPTLDIDIGLNLAGGFAILGSFAQATGTGVEVITVNNVPDNCSFDVTIGGTTPSLDYEIIRIFSTST